MHQSKGGTWHAFLDHRTKLRANRRQNPSRRHFRPCLLLASRRRDDVGAPELREDGRVAPGPAQPDASKTHRARSQRQRSTKLNVVRSKVGRPGVKTLGDALIPPVKERPLVVGVDKVALHVIQRKLIGWIPEDLAQIEDLDAAVVGL